MILQNGNINFNTLVLEVIFSYLFYLEDINTTLMCILMTLCCKTQKKIDPNINWIMLKKNSDIIRLKKILKKWVELCNDPVVNNTDVLSFQSTWSVQNNKENTVRKIRTYLNIY